MKKQIFLSSMILAVALIFAGCSNSSSSGGGNQESDLPKMDVSEFSDCTVSATSIEAANGSQWSVRFEGNEESFASRAADAAPEIIIEIDATAEYSGNDFTFTSAKFFQTMRTKDCFKEGYEQYKNYDAATKAYINTMVITKTAQMFEAENIGTLIESESSMDENYIKIAYTLSDTYKAQFETAFKASLAQSNKNIKTNSGKNKYIVSVSDNSYYMKKLN